MKTSDRALELSQREQNGGYTNFSHSDENGDDDIVVVHERRRSPQVSRFIARIFL